MKTTIGIPVYNEARFLENTIQSVVEQADKVIICDNASTDGTEDICRRFLAKYPKIRYERFEKNRGAAASFMRCLQLADTEYFMWVGGHDLLDEGHVAKLSNVLDQNSDIVQSYSNALHLDQHYRYMKFYYYDWNNLLMNDSVDMRVAASVLYMYDCTIFHGLYRRQILCDYFKYATSKLKIAAIFIDHIILAYIAMRGKMALATNCNYIRIQPREADVSLEESWRRAIKAIDPSLPDNPHLFPESIYLGQKQILTELKSRHGSNREILTLATTHIVKWLQMFNKE